MKKATQLALGILTAVGGFFDVGNIATCAQAGASFRFQLLWSMVLATIVVIFLVEMSGRFAAVTKKALPDTIREHFGFSFWLVPFLVLTIVHVLVLGAVIAPYLFYFYSSGAVEDDWDETYIPINRAVSVLGMGFGSVISLGAIIVAGIVLAPRGIKVSDYHQAALMLTDAFPFWGYALFAASMAIACLGAALEVALSMSYSFAQTFGWNWGEDLSPTEDARFCLVYTISIFLG